MFQEETSVLIVEPDLDAQKIYRKKLIHDPSIKLLGICSSMGSAVSMLERSACDILVTELGLPDGDGCHLIAKANNLFNVSSCIVFTNKASLEQVYRLVESGIVGFLLKPESNLDEIANYVRMVRNGGTPLSPSIARIVLETLKKQIQEGATLKAGPLIESTLSSRESEILVLLARGMSFADISTTLKISYHTVTAHVKKIYRKLQVHSRGEAVYEAARLRILPQEILSKLKI